MTPKTEALPTPVVLTIPFAAMASVNDRTIPTATGRQILSESYRRALTDARLLVAKQWRGLPWDIEASLTIRFYWPDKRRRDETNYVKLLEDALMPRALKDDAQIYDTRTIRAGIDPQRPRAELELVPRGWGAVVYFPPPEEAA
jgi:Holliday junction resolvase RusA-like endonuclease